MAKVFLILGIYLFVIIWSAIQKEAKKKTKQRERQAAWQSPRPSPALRQQQRQEMAQALSEILDDASPEELEEMLAAGEPSEELKEMLAEPAEAPEERRPLPSEAPATPRSLARDPVGESYAAPIPPPHTSPLEGSKTPAMLHAEEHMGTPLQAGEFPVHPSEAALHADAHIATTPATPTPHPASPQPHSKPIPRGSLDVLRTATGIRKAVLFSEILGRPRCLRPPRQEI